MVFHYKYIKTFLGWVIGWLKGAAHSKTEVMYLREALDPSTHLGRSGSCLVLEISAEFNGTELYSYIRKYTFNVF